MLERPNTLRRSNIVLNSFGSCISNTPEESSSAPKMSSSEIISQPRMFVQKFKGSVSFKQLECFADRHCWWQINKQVDVVNSDVKFIDFASILDSNFVDKSLTINSNSKKFKWVPSILGFPDKMLGILSNGMFKMSQIHFFAPQTIARNKAHAKFVNLFHEPNNKARYTNEFQELNFMEKGSPPKLKSKGIRAPAM